MNVAKKVTEKPKQKGEIVNRFLTHNVISDIQQQIVISVIWVPDVW